MGRQLSTFLLSIFGKMLQEEVTNVSLLFMESIFQSAEAGSYLPAAQSSELGQNRGEDIIEHIFIHE